MNWQAICFWMVAAITLIPALTILFEPSIVRSAFWLLGTLTGVAGLYLMLGADFLGMTQIMVYIGGINVLLLFGIMLTQKEPVYVAAAKKTVAKAPALMMGVAVLAVLLGCILNTKWRISQSVDVPTSKAIGTYLMTDYILPFEIVSVLLLVVLVGAAYLARRTQDEGART